MLVRSLKTAAGCFLNAPPFFPVPCFIVLNVGNHFSGQFAVLFGNKLLEPLFFAARLRNVQVKFAGLRGFVLHSLYIKKDLCRAVRCAKCTRIISVKERLQLVIPHRQRSVYNTVDVPILESL